MRLTTLYSSATFSRFSKIEGRLRVKQKEYSKSRKLALWLVVNLVVISPVTASTRTSF